MLIGIALVLVLLNIHPIRSENNSTDGILPVGNPLTFLAENLDELKTTLPGIILQNLMSNQIDQSILSNSYSVGTCLKDLLEILTQLKNRNENALRMIDAWGKFPSGLLTGNFYEFGSFDECFEVEIRRQRTDDYIHPQYCLAQVSFMTDKQGITHQTHANKNIAGFDNVNIYVQNRIGVPNLESSKISLNIGTCIPASCPPKFIETILNTSLSTLMPSFAATVDVSPERCQFEIKPSKFTAVDIVMAAILIVVFCLIFVSTLYDIVCTINGKKKNDLLMAYSALTNSRKIFTLRSRKSPEVFNCLDGIRAISTAWVVLGHSYYMHTIFPTENMTSILSWVSNNYVTFVTAAPLAVDTFFIISGLMAVLLPLKHLKKSKGRLNIFTTYLHRYIRLTPLLAAVALFQSSVIKFFGDGPRWTQIVHDLQVHCKRDWWKLLLYFQNYKTTHEKICVGHSWYLSVDMQLFIVAPFLAYCLYRFKSKFLVVVILAILASMGSAFYAYIYYENAATSDNTNLIYHPTHIRMLTWLVGVILAYFLFHTRSKKVHIPKVVNVLAWFASLSSLIAAILTQYPLIQPANNSSQTDHALYNVFSRLLWAVALSYIIFACTRGYGGPINWFLSLEVWQPLSRLSYAIYLVHADIMVVINGSMRDALQFSNMFVIYKFFGYYVMSTLVATLASLAFESPIINLEKIIFRTGTGSKSDGKSVEELAK